MQKTITKTVLAFALRLTLILGVSFSAHGYIQHVIKIGFFEKQLVLTYIFNYLLTILFFFALVYFKQRKSAQLGFIFLLSSITKFVLFLVLIYPNFEDTSNLRNGEFAAFFVPYSIGLFMETFQIVRTLNRE